MHVCSSKREPLGKGYVRGHQIPNGLGSATPFGVAIHAKVGPVQAQSKGRCISMQHGCAASKSLQFTAKLQKRTPLLQPQTTDTSSPLFACRSLIEQVRQSQPCSPKIILQGPAGTLRTPHTPCMSHPMGHMQQGNNVIGTMTGTGQALTLQPIPLVTQPVT